MDANYVYWTESYLNGSSNAGKVFRAPKAGGSRELMRSYGNRLRDLKPDGNGSVYFIHAGIVIVIIPIPDILYRVSPVAGGTFTETSVGATVNSYALSGSDVFWAEGINTSDRLIKSAAQSNTASALTRATISGVGNPRMLNMNIDSRNVYWNEVRYSNDNGAKWIVLEPSTTNRQLSVDMSRMPGGTQALVQVMASDGLDTSVAVAGPFNVAKHLPTATVMDNAYNELSPALGIAAAQSETVVLRGFGYDAEDGTLPNSALRWQISGPITRTGDGTQLTLIGLAPGSYSASLTATDTDGNVTTAMTTLTISPKRVFDSAGVMALA